MYVAAPAAPEIIPVTELIVAPSETIGLKTYEPPPSKPGAVSGKPESAPSQKGLIVNEATSELFTVSDVVELASVHEPSETV